MARQPSSEHSRHAAYARTSRSKHLRAWLTLRATALALTGSQMFRVLQVFGADIASQAAGSEPANSVLPSITGTTTNGETLTCVAGTWHGLPTPSIVRAWLRDGVVVGGQTATTYVLGAGDVGTVISVRETATNTAGVVAATSGVTAVIADIEEEG